jgi:tetratricopeptide (TPR) repeat protein
MAMFMKSLKYYLIIILLQIILISSACESDRDKKIKLATSNDTQENKAQLASTVLRISPEEQRSIAIFYFSNEINDPNLNWLNRGLADMLVAELTQSPYLHVIPTNRLMEVAEKLGRSLNELADPIAALVIAKETNAEIILTGRFYKSDQRIKIDSELIDVNTGQMIHRETVSGESMERIFAMVDRLSERVRRNLRGEPQERQTVSSNLAQMTTSLEAFKCYSLALENREKLFFEEAEKCLEDAIKADHTFAAGYLRLAGLKMHMKKWDEAKRALEKTHQYAHKLSDPDQISLKLLETRMRGEYHKLIPILIEASNRYPSNVDFRLELARNFKETGKLDQALEQFEIAREIDPNRKTIYNDLAYIYAARGDFSTAIGYIDRYRELAPDEPNPYDSKGEILMWAGKLDEAINHFQKALVKWPKFYNSARQLSQLYSELGHFDKALEYINYVNEISNAAYVPYMVNFDKGLLYWKFGMIKEAANCFKLAMKQEPWNIYPVLVMGEMYKSSGNSTATKKLYSNMFQRFKNEILKYKADFKGARDFAKFVLETDLPSIESIPILEKMAHKQKDPFISTELKATIGVLYARSGEYDKAIPYFEEGNFSLVDVIARYMEADWGSVWKYISQTISKASKYDPSMDNLSQRLSEKAAETDKKNLEYMAQLIRAHSSAVATYEENLNDIYRNLGVPLDHQWYVVGPFPQRNKSGFQNEFAPEKDRKITTIYNTGDHKLNWIEAKDGAYDGYINLKEIFQPSSWAVAYSSIYVFSPDERKVQIRMGSDETCKIWLNEELIWQHFLKRGALIDRDLVTVVLHPGYNKIMLKVTNSDQEWGYYFRITDEKGNGITDLHYYSPAEVDKSLAWVESSEIEKK